MVKLLGLFSLVLVLLVIVACQNPIAGKEAYKNIGIPFQAMFDETLDSSTLNEIRDHILLKEQVSTNQKYPILLVPGFAGTDYWDTRFAQLDYWNKVEEFLSIYDFNDVFVADIDCFNYSTNGPLTQYLPEEEQEKWNYLLSLETVPVVLKGRSEQVADRVEEILRITGAEKVNIIAHSQGALTARWFITNLGGGKHVNALLTLSGANKGVKLTKVALNKEEFNIPQKIIEPALKTVNLLFGRLSNSDTSETQYAINELYPPYTEELFNPQCPDDPNVKYFSLSARLKEVAPETYSSKINSLVWTTHVLYNYMNWGPNDGVIDVDSMKGPFHDSPDSEIAQNWKYLGELIGKPVSVFEDFSLGYDDIYIGTDHLVYSNLPMGTSQKIFDLQIFYRDIARLLNAYSL